MEATPALVITHHDLQQMLDETAQRTATETVAQLRTDLRTDPVDRIVHQLRTYLADRSNLDQPQAVWANSHHIRRVALNTRGKPRSVAWFHRFKVESGLGDCSNRTSAQHGRLQEWTFEDIANAWDQYYILR